MSEHEHRMEHHKDGGFLCLDTNCDFEITKAADMTALLKHIKALEGVVEAVTKIADGLQAIVAEYRGTDYKTNVVNPIDVIEFAAKELREATEVINAMD